MAAGRRQCVSDRGNSLRAIVASATFALLGAVSAYASNRALDTTDADDRFDTSLLRVDEAAHLDTVAPNVTVLTANGSRKLYDLIDEKPTIVVLTYFTCGHACPLITQNLAQSNIDAPSSDYEVLVLSFDVNDTVQTMQHARSGLDHIPENWTFGLLSAADNADLTGAVGFNFLFSERDKTFVHPSVLVFLSPQGEVMRYLYGVDPQHGDIELALIESRNRTPTLNEFVDMVRLTCFQYDGSKSRYVLHPTVIFGGAGFGVLGLVGLVAFSYRKGPKGEV